MLPVDYVSLLGVMGFSFVVLLSDYELFKDASGYSIGEVELFSPSKGAT